MNERMKLVKIPEEEYSSYRYEIISRGYKWDPQVEDANTISEYAVILDKETVDQLASMAEQLAQETMVMEEELLGNLPYVKELGLPRVMIKAMEKSADYRREDHVRLMRFDFHPTDQGWMISEVNSDVPGGFAESSVLPVIAARYLGQGTPSEDFSVHLFEAFAKRVKKNGTIAFVYATSYADDRQVMQFMGDYFKTYGYEVLYLAPDHVRFRERRAYSILGDEEQEIDGIVRFFPLEWLPDLPLSSKWRGYYNTLTVSCNHPVAMLTQSKRLPLIWDKLQAGHDLWKNLLPKTQAVIPINYGDEELIYKPVFGRVGGGITIKEAMEEREFRKVRKEALKRKKEWIVQKKFRSIPVAAADGKEFHLCVGVFVVDGCFSGFYGRISLLARIDEKAKDIPVLIKTEKNEG